MEMERNWKMRYIDEIEKISGWRNAEIPLAVKDNIGRTVDFSAGRNRYIGYLISMATRSFKNKKVGLDCSNGSACCDCTQCI